MRRAAVVLGVGLALFALFAADLLVHGPLTAADPGISAWLHDRMHPLATQVLVAVTQVHSTIGISIMSALLAMVLAAVHRWRDIGWMLVTVQGGQVLNAVVKSLFHRPRPHWDHPMIELSTASFPSGHASGSTFFWGFVLVTVWASPLPVSIKRGAAVIAATMIAVTALSRVYLGAHYPSDVLAGISEGVAWVSLWVLVRISCRTRAARPSPNRAA